MIWFHILLLELTLLLFIYCYLLLSVWSELCPKGFELQFIGQMWYNNLQQKWWFVFQTKYSFKSICCYYISRLHTLLNEELIIKHVLTYASREWIIPLSVFSTYQHRNSIQILPRTITAECEDVIGTYGNTIYW